MVFDLPFGIHTSDIGQFAAYAGTIAIFLVCLLSIQVALVRFNFLQSQKRGKKLRLVWRDIISKVIVGEKPVYPQICKRDVFFVLEEYGNVFGVIRGKELDTLRESFNELVLPVTLTELLRSHDMEKKLYALVTLGNMRDESAWDIIKENLLSKQVVVSFSAARALVLINPEKAMKEVVPIILDREAWPWANVAHVLTLAGSTLACRKLSEIIAQAPEYKQSSLLRLYGLLHCEAECPITKQVIENAKEDKVISVCLNVSQDPDIIGHARKYATHSRWHVRMNAAVAIGRFGTQDDIFLLEKLIKDKEWWVRYRAAQALVSMPFIDEHILNEIRRTINDRYAGDILAQALEEFSYAE